MPNIPRGRNKNLVDGTEDKMCKAQQAHEQTEGIYGSAPTACQQGIAWASAHHFSPT